MRVTWDDHLHSLRKQELGYRTVIAPPSAKAEDSGMGSGEGQLGREGLGVYYRLNCVFTKIHMMKS